MAFRSRWGAPMTLDTMLQQVAIFIVTAGAAAVFAAIAWAGHHQS